MKPFLASSLATCCVLALSSFAFTPTVAPANRSASQGPSLKIESITTTITITINPKGEKEETRVTKLSCAGPAYDCGVNSAGETVHVAPREV